MKSNHQSAKLCSLCQGINVSRKLFPERYTQVLEKELTRDDSIELGTLETIRARTETCVLCEYVAGRIVECEDKFSKSLKGWEVLDYTLEWERYGSTLETIDLPHATRFRLNIVIKSADKWRMNLAHVPNILQPSLWPVPSLELQLMNPTWSDTDSRGGRLRPLTCEPGLLRSWLRTCEEKYPKCLSDRTAVIPELRFIDIKLRCVSKAHSYDNDSLRYVALSYVWGRNAQRLTLTRGNCTHLGEIVSLQPEYISQTIADAFRVVEMLGERYLWVDSLSIVQDDENDLAAHLPSMGSIYHRAVLTIIAGSGVDANSGLPGIQQSRSAQHIMGPLGGGALIACCIPRIKNINDLGSQHHYLDGSEWNSRGWTLQEKVFSRRCLYFMEEQIYWECKMDSWCEESCFEAHQLRSSAEKRCSWREGASEMGSSPLLEGIGIGTGMITPVERQYFKKYVRDYSRRSLTFDEDAERAIAGLLQTLSEYTGAQFWHGLPIPIFDECIWWGVTGEAVRRSSTTWPSWSWLAWKDEVWLSNEQTFDLCQIQCYRLCLNRTGQRFLERVSDRNISPEDSRPVDQSDIPTAVWPRLQPDLHILFWAQTCVFDVRNGDQSFSHVFRIPVDPTIEIKVERSVSRNHRNGRGDIPLAGHHEFTLFQTESAHREGIDRDETPQRHYTYLLSWQDGIAKREWSAETSVDEWGKYTAPQWKLIIMR